MQRPSPNQLPPRQPAQQQPRGRSPRDMNQMQPGFGPPQRQHSPSPGQGRLPPHQMPQRLQPSPTGAQYAQYAQQPQYYAPGPPPQQHLQYQQMPNYMQPAADPYNQYAQFAPPPRQTLPQPAALPPPPNGNGGTPLQTSLLARPGAGAPGGGAAIGMQVPVPPPTHYGKVAILMLILGGATGYGFHSATMGSACSARYGYASNETRQMVLTGVLSSLHVSNPDALAGQLDAWVSYETGAVSSAASPLTGWLTTPTAGAAPCGDGLFLAGPTPSPANIIIYMALLLWSFVGVAIGADVRAPQRTTLPLSSSPFSQLTLL